MDALPTSMLPLTPLKNTPDGTLPVATSLGNFAENSESGQSGLFSLLLSQLSLTEPLATPTNPADDRILTQLSAQLADADLPLAGNGLPLSLQQLPIDELPELARALNPELADADSELLADAQALQASITPLTTSAVPVQLIDEPVIDAGVTLRKHGAPTPTPVVTTPIDVTGDEAGQLLQQQQQATASVSAAKPLLEEVAGFERYETVQRATVPVTVTPTVAPAAQSPLTPLTPAAGASAPQQSFVLQQPVADPNWGDELGQRLVWMTENGIGRAQLRMNPPELGPIEVRMAVANDDARVSFHVQHGATREALESAMPRLREMFASQGLNLSDANVSEQSTGQQQQAGNASREGRDDAEQHGDFDQYGLAEAMNEAPPDDARVVSVEGTIDAYA